MASSSPNTLLSSSMALPRKGAAHASRVWSQRRGGTRRCWPAVRGEGRKGTKAAKETFTSGRKAHASPSVVLTARRGSATWTRLPAQASRVVRVTPPPRRPRGRPRMRTATPPSCWTRQRSRPPSRTRTMRGSPTRMRWRRQRLRGPSWVAGLAGRAPRNSVFSGSGLPT